MSNMPIVAILRVDQSAVDAPPPVFLRLLTRAPLDSEAAGHLSDLCSRPGFLRAALTSERFDSLRVVPAEAVRRGNSRPVCVLTVCLVDDGAVCHLDDNVVNELSLGLRDAPWSPEVLVACLGKKEEAVAALGTTLDAHFSGSAIRYFELCPGGDEPESFWWWRHHGHRIGVLTTSGERLSDGLERILIAVRESGIETAGSAPVFLTPERLLAGGEAISGISLIVLDLHDKWAFAEGLPASARQKEEREAARKAFTERMMTAIDTLRCNVRLALPRNRAPEDLHPEILDALESTPAILPDTIFVPIGTQLRAMSAEVRLRLAAVGQTDGVDHGGDETTEVLAAEKTVLVGQREVIAQQIALQEARGGGDLAKRLDSLFEASAQELQRIIDHQIEVVTRDLRAGAYPGTNGEPHGPGSRYGDRWSSHCTWRDQLLAKWTHQGQPGDGHNNWVISTPMPNDTVARYMNPRRTMESHPRVQALIAEAISLKCEDGIARLVLTTDLFLETVVRGESRAILRELQLDGVTNRSNGSFKADPLPSGAHRATGLAGRRASETISAAHLCAGVTSWPRVEKVPHHLNLRQNLKSVGLLFRQGGKLFAALLVVVVMLGEAGQLASRDQADQGDQLVGDDQDDQFVSRLKKNAGTLFDDPRLIFFVVLGLIVTVGLSVGAHWAQIAEKLDKLRDDTHRALEEAAAKQLAVARNVISNIVSDDLDALRTDLQTAIQARDGKTLKSLGADLRAIETRIIDRENDIETRKKLKDQSDKQLKDKRKQAATILKKFFSLKGLME